MTSIKIPTTLHNKLLQAVVAEGYGMRGKSKWVTEAIENFLVLPNHRELVDIASEMEDLAVVMSLRLPEALALRLEDAMIEVRKSYPSMEGVKSNIIRASIIQRMIRGYTSVTEV